MTDVTNEALGRLIGLTHSAVSRLLAGERTPSVSTMKTIARVFDRPLSEVVEAASQSDNTDRRGTLWGSYFRGVVAEADLEAANARAAELVDAAPTG